MADCLFCKIIAGEIPAHRVYEDNATVAFLDIGPVTPGHTLVVPRVHHTSLSETPDDVIRAVYASVKKVAAAAMAATGATAFNAQVNNGAAAGQLVFHTHVHVIPRRADDGLVHWPHQKPSPEVLAALAEKIRANV